jgi:hypothetical protein
VPTVARDRVARRVEDSIATIEGIKHMATSITDGQVATMIEFELGTRSRMRSSTSRMRSIACLPRDLEEPQLGHDPAGRPATYAIHDDSMNEEALSWFTDDTVARAAARAGVRTLPTRRRRATRSAGQQNRSVRMQALEHGRRHFARAQARGEASGGHGAQR